MSPIEWRGTNLTLSSKILIRLKRQICPQFGLVGLKEAIWSAGKLPHINSHELRRRIGKEEKCGLCYKEPSPAII